MNFESPLPSPHENSGENSPSGPLLQWSDLGPPVPPSFCPPPSGGLVSDPPRVVNWETHNPFEEEWNQRLEALHWTWEWTLLESCWMHLMALDIEHFPGRLIPEVLDTLANAHFIPASLLELLLWYTHLPHHRYHQGFHAALSHLLSEERKLAPAKHQLVSLSCQYLAAHLANGKLPPVLLPPLSSPPPPSGRSVLHIEPENDD